MIEYGALGDDEQVEVSRRASTCTPSGTTARARSAYGASSKLHAVCDGNGCLVATLLTEGQMSDHKGAALLLPVLPPARELLGDRTARVARRSWAASASRVTATVYRSRHNEAAMAKRRLISMVHFRKPKGRSLPASHAKANAARSTIRSAIEHVFAGQKHRMKLFVRTIGIARAKVKIGMANLAYTFTRVAWLEAQAAPV